MSGVVVVGSANVDVVLGVGAIPRPGETVLARSSERHPGGKGANQAVAAARDGAPTTFVAAVGDDPGAEIVVDALTGAGVDLSVLRRTPGPTGTAYIAVDPEGENAIIVDPAANATLRDLFDAERAAVNAASVLLAQLEIPVETVAAAAATAKESGGLTVLNAAPAQPLPDELWPLLDVLVVNEEEALTLAGETDLDAAVAALLRRVPEVVVTLGGRGALLATRDGDPVVVPVDPVPVVDTTGAGDTFCGVFGAARARGAAPLDAVRRAIAAASLTVQRTGAVPSIPTAAETDERLDHTEALR
jgi:ribokinase